MTREQKRQRGKAYRAILEGLAPKHGTIIKCPGDQPHNRIAYQQINAICYGLWGPSTYKLQSRPSAVAVIRLPLTSSAPAEARRARGEHASSVTGRSSLNSTAGRVRNEPAPGGSFGGGA